MASTFVKDRRQELQKLGEERKLNWKDSLKGLPQDDDGLIVAFLAATLHYNIQSAFDPSKSIADMNRESQIAQDQAKELDELHHALTPLISGPKE